MKQSLLWKNKELFPGIGIMSRWAFIAVSTKGFLRPFFGKNVHGFFIFKQHKGVFTMIDISIHELKSISLGHC